MEHTNTITLGGVSVDLMERDAAIEKIAARSKDTSSAPLGVVSINLDHIHHFGPAGRWRRSLDTDRGRAIEWLDLIDGAPLAAQAQRVTGRAWPRLAGSDLAGPILDNAARDGVSVGFLGGDTSTHDTLRVKFAAERPDLVVSGFWAPSRDELSDPVRAGDIAAEIAAAGTDILVVGLGKPRQELWIAEHAAESGARVLLAFGAVVDFLAERIERSPDWVAAAGLEWAWRLSREPRRLANRYLVAGPPAYATVRRASGADVAPRRELPAARDIRRPITSGRFVDETSDADVAVVVVTYNSADDLPGLLASLRREAATVTMRVIVADNGSTDGTRELIAAETDVIAASTGGNVGYARGINAAMTHAVGANTVLILNPDLSVEAGAIEAMLRRLDRSGAGIVVPSIVDDAGEVYPSLRREPTISRTIGDSLLGSRASGRPEWASEIDFDAESYRHPHEVEWATGAALLIDSEVAAAVGEWDGRFFLYSEETDFFRRARDAGYSIWYEPAATVRHSQGGSGSSVALDSLLAVNKVRYARKHRSAGYATGIHIGAILGEVMRSYDPAHRQILRTLLDQRSWRSLPRAVEGSPLDSTGDTIGAVIIPAHNEATVIARTLSPLADLAANGRLEVWVVCNGCSDATAEIARGFDGVNVLEIDEASKTAALNAGDAAASAWPRLYLDGDIAIEPSAVAAVFARLAGSPVLAARPAYRYLVDSRSPIVTSYYRARQRMPSMSAAMWGAGAYALSKTGHERFGMFPAVTGDDLFVDQTFTAAEKRVVPCAPVVVRTPKTASALVAVLARQSRGSEESTLPATSRGTIRELIATVHGPRSFVDAALYATLTVFARRLARRSTAVVWERDDSTR
ncbi:WecB/TagA/CpsF family glycosyltransferase [Lacisediminihabitans changchengi]|uniref:WecB/TagA/CpsF family glycosyltransferase n=1 Tax=Lacisediminihabitans changchengi TaxID=2787634 RepID=A0A934SNY1_9MICO|nr:WecB/TagA/CpsF family glycosyltransferase [Lacisediminihabitans changchengi]MBK4348507.1 WecB/TagA/CpsF family glycosyltransferase [Lacisediminihabitans changchengi]